jgi:O-antigen/teichoic acid export membrane protein
MSGLDSAGDGRHLDGSLLSSVAWTGAARAVAQTLSWLVTLAVARILSPTDYGLIAMSGVLICAVQVLSEFGIGSAVVTLRELNAEALARLNGLALLVGALACLVSMLCAAPAAVFFGTQAVGPVILVSSIGFAVSSFRIVPAALLRRDLAFKRLALIDAAASLVQSTVVVVSAALGSGLWALVWGPLASQAFSTVTTVLTRPVRMRSPTVTGLRGSLTFTRHQLTTSILWYCYTSADFAVAGRVLGEKFLGLYYLAWTFSRTVPEKVSGLVVSIAPAYFSAVQDNRVALRRYLLRLTEVIALLTFPALAGVALLADSLEAEFLGAAWTGLAPPLRMLAAHAMLTAVAPLPGRVLTALRDTRFLMRVSFMAAATLVPGFLLGSRWGPVGIAAAWLIIEPVFQFATLRRACEAIDLPLAQYFQAVSVAISMTAVMAAAVWCFLSVAPTGAGLPRIGSAIAVGVVAYAGAGLALHGRRLRALARAIWLQREAIG